jgi:hypothetical protein
MSVRLSRCIAYCLERARACREKGSAASLASQRNFSDLEDWCLGFGRELRILGAPGQQDQ